MRRNTQVLICPGCQSAGDWTSDLDRCARCASVHLVRRLGEVECRDCGAIVPPAGGPADEVTAAPGSEALTEAGRNPDLSEEVARALERVLRQGLVAPSTHRAGDAHSG